MWDNWLFFHNGKHYLFYLSGEPEKKIFNLYGKATYDNGVYKNAFLFNILAIGYMTRWNGIGIATSSDGVNWKEHGFIINKKDKDVVWMGSGHTWASPDFKNDGKFFMNFSEWRGDRQTIFFAESTDLLNWDRLSDNYEFKQDPKYYIEDGRWDCIYAIDKTDRGFYGYWTAAPKPQNRLGFGFGESIDGVNWKALPSPEINWDDKYSKPTFSYGSNMEVGAVEKIGEKYYALVHVGEWAMGTLVSERPNGPFRPAQKNYYILGQSNTCFTRFYRSPESLLISHYAWDQSFQNIYFAPLKTPIVDSEGTLRLGWWKGNEKIKGRKLKFNIKEKSNTDSKIFMAKDVYNTKDGIILEGTMDLADNGLFKRDFIDFLTEDGKKIIENIEADIIQKMKLTGLYIEYENEKGIVFLFDSKGVLRYGAVDSNGLNFKCHGHVTREMTFGRSAIFRLLVKSSMVEIYLDNVLMQSYNLTRPATGRIGIIPGGRKDIMENIKVWNFDMR